MGSIEDFQLHLELLSFLGRLGTDFAPTVSMISPLGNVQ